MKLLLGDLRDTVDRLAFGPGERLLAAVAGHGRVDLWDAVSGRQADSWSSRQRTVTDLAWLADGRAVVAVGTDSLELIDPAGGTSEKLSRSGQALRVVANLASPALFAVSRHRSARAAHLLHMVVGEQSARVAWAEDLAGDRWSLTADADGSRVAAPEFSRPPVLRGRGSQIESAVVIREGETGDIRRRIPVPHWSVTDRLTMFPDGRLVAAYITDRVHIWDAGSGDAVGEIRPPGFSSNTTAMAAHPDGRRLLTAGQDGAARVWDAVTAAPLAEFHWGIGKLASVAVSRDGLLAAVGGEDGRVVVWDLDG